MTDELVDQAGRVQWEGNLEGAAGVVKWLAGYAPDWNDDAEGGGGILWTGGLVPLRFVTITGDGGARGWSMRDLRVSNSYDAISPATMLEVFAFAVDQGGYGSAPGPPAWSLTWGDTTALRAAVPALGNGDGLGDPFAQP